VQLGRHAIQSVHFAEDAPDILFDDRVFAGSEAEELRGG
jgi:hypothetical protein